MGLKFCSDFFWVRDFGKDFLGGLNWTFLGLQYVLGRWTFFGSGSSLKDFFCVEQFRLIRTSPSLIYLSTPPGQEVNMTINDYSMFDYTLQGMLNC